MKTSFPTPNSELNAVLHDFVKSIQEVLRDNFVSAYLQGSFAIGDWDNDSDVDFTVVTDHDVSAGDLISLQSIHKRIYNLESDWAKHLEGSYFPKQIIKNGDTSKKDLLYLDNTYDQLIWSNHDNTLVVRWIIREYGIVLAGNTPKELIDPVSADALRQEITATMREWSDEILCGKLRMSNKWAQPFAVVSYCRMLQSLQTGRISSKLSAVQWAKIELDKRWAGMIQKAWDERPNPSLKVRQPAEPNEVKKSLKFIQYALKLSQTYDTSNP